MIDAFAQTTTSSEFLAFRLGREEYAIDIQTVQELRGYEAPTAIANAPDWFKGVVNLRGAITPVIDMRLKLNLGAPTYNDTTVVVVLRIDGATIGMVVDSVSDVIQLEPGQCRPAPEMGTAVDASYLIGLATLEERMLILVDITRLLSSAELGLVQRKAA